ncbi:MAG: hypothetical protein JSU66_03705 [Deltaproteobacteria bacterium]|nr:MAG: hypothetical protein JSU66_03705 [Deltaproteobacteria bacterium]
MAEADGQPLRQLGFDDPDCREVAHMVGIFNHRTRLADGFGCRGLRSELEVRSAQSRVTGG